MKRFTTLELHESETMSKKGAGGELKDNSMKFKENVCHSCGTKNMFVFYTMKGVPVHSVVNIPVREKALECQRGDILLAFCHFCGFISNVAYNPALLEYSFGYESTQTFSPTFNTFARNLADRLVDRYKLYNKVILEIGCGNGEFLELLCRLGNNRGVGFDPAYKKERMSYQAKAQITFIKDYYSEKYANFHAEFLCCRMTLEHIMNTANFVSIVRRSLKTKFDVIVFFQVPDVTRILRTCAFEDIYYEHCSYFSPGSLARLFRKCGFDVIRLETEYDNQYLMIEAKPVDGKSSPFLPEEEEPAEMKGIIENFQRNIQRKIFLWRKRLLEIHTNGKRAVLWGSGSKAVAFLTTLNIQTEIKYVVDINPHRQGTYIAGTGQEIVAPEFLKEYKPNLIIVMNAVYKAEIKKDLKLMGLDPEVITL